MDCDVEEPNGALFLKPQIRRTEPVYVSVPRVDSGLCNGCGLCGQICQYSAIVTMNGKVLVFPELCHGCGGCWLVCPTGAVTESFRQTGKVEEGPAGKIHFVQGLLNIGEAMSPPVIRQAKSAAAYSDLLIIDSPPGTSCPVIESVRGADYVLLVTEPTPFGLNDLKLAVDMVRALQLPFGVVVNRAGSGDHATDDYCAAQGIDILPQFRDAVCRAYSRGEMICDEIPVGEPSSWNCWIVSEG